jgi:integrase
MAEKILPPNRTTTKRKRTATKRLMSTNIAKPGFHRADPNLYLQVSEGPNGVRKSWVFRYQFNGGGHDMGLGSASNWTLAEARQRARLLRQQLDDGIDPFQRREDERAKAAAEAIKVLTFDECADRYIAEHEAGWVDGHRNAWVGSLKQFASPIIGALAVDKVDTAAVLRVLKPIWNTKVVTASRLRGRIETVLGWASVHGFRSGDNPARWAGHLREALPKPTSVATVVRQPSLPYQQCGAFLRDLRARQESMATLALEATILTAVRSYDTRNAKRADVDRAAKTWTIPSFSKTGRELRVALSDAALAAFDKAAVFADAIDTIGSGLAFPGAGGHPLGENSMLNIIAEMGLAQQVTTHGFRASFKTWAMERTNFARELQELALGHTLPGNVEAAYMRSDMFEKRRKLMQAWATFLDAKPAAASGKVIAIGAKQARG